MELMMELHGKRVRMSEGQPAPQLRAQIAIGVGAAAQWVGWGTGKYRVPAAVAARRPARCPRRRRVRRRGHLTVSVRYARALVAAHVWRARTKKRRRAVRCRATGPRSWAATGPRPTGNGQQSPPGPGAFHSRSRLVDSWPSFPAAPPIARSSSAPLPATSVHQVGRMRKGLHPQMQWISYVTQSGRLINIMMTKVNHTGKVYHMRAKRQMAQSLGQIAKFKRRYEQEAEENKEK
ncbi:hypothetical protein C2845_PM05G16670 [Panicum miliaceum]|uniref:Uncharacterized protein n=4 Tax=Panicum TaxID=4539 RepID=A0A3L6T2T0_PANMI|nr:hypothetical protein C2845_PM05G16670 [Panicum miliaceum]